MGTLKLETLAIVRDLPSGEVLVTSAADLGAACVGEEELALLELRAYLTAQLGRSAPEQVARHALPAGTRLHLTDVKIPREDLPRRVAIAKPVEITSLVIPVVKLDGRPSRDDAWVVIVPLSHTVFVRAGEDIDEVVRREVLRLIAANEAGPRDYLSLLPGEADSLEPLEIEPSFGESGVAGRAASLRRALLAHEKRKNAVLVLESVAQALHSAWEGDREHGRPLIGRDRELGLLSGLLGGKERLSCLVVGEARTGKTAVIRAWFESALKRGNTPLVYATSGAQLIAGMSGLGQWQERVRRVMEAAELLDAILVFDDLADLFAEHGQSVVDLSGAMKPYVEDGRVRIVGELHPDRLDFIETRSPAFFGSLHRIRLEPMGAQESLAALEAHVGFDRKRYPDRATLADAACAPLVELAGRYLPYQAFPGKAISLYRELVVARALESRPEPIGADEVFEAMSSRTGVPAFLLRDDRSLLMNDIVKALSARVLGQADAVRAVAETLCVVKAKLQPPSKPLATFLFIGPTGVGKTELARALATYLFGSDTRLLRLDMSEYADTHAADRLFQGGPRRDGFLARKIREQPFSVVLLDEIEKAHPSVLDVLLQVCGEGRLTDARGKTAHFQDAIIVLTSNLGAAHRQRPIGVARAGADARSHYLKAVDESFRPELVNRLDRIVVFDPLTPVEASGVVRLVVDKVTARRGLVDSGISLEVTERSLERLVEGGFSPAHGARSVRRYVEDQVVTPIADLLAKEAEHASRARVVVASVDEPPRPVAPGFMTAAELRGEAIAVRLDRRLKGAATRDVLGLEDISDVRRQMQSHLALDPVIALKEQAQLVFTQLFEATSATKKRAKRPVSNESRESVTTLMTEHHRLKSLLDALENAYRRVLDLEELAIEALIDGQGVSDLLGEVDQTRRAFRAPLARAMVALEPRRDTAVVLLHELDGGRCFDLYLAPMLREAKRLGWNVRAHFPDEGGEAWPPENANPKGPRRFGPPRPAEDLMARLDGRGGARPRSIMLSVRGDSAGVFLAFESGLHHYVNIAANLTETMLMVQLLSLNAQLTDAEWLRPMVAPLMPADAGIHKRARPTRLVHAADETITILGSDEHKLSMRLGEVWPRIEEVILEHLLLCAEDERFDRSTFLVEAAVKVDAETDGAEAEH